MSGFILSTYTVVVRQLLVLPPRTLRILRPLALLDSKIVSKDIIKIQKKKKKSPSCYDPETQRWTRYRPGVAQRVGRSIALLFHDRGTRRGWVISSTPRPHFTPGKDPVLVLQEAGWAPGSVWTGGKSRPHGDSIPDLPACSQSLYRLSYRAHRLPLSST